MTGERAVVSAAVPEAIESGGDGSAVVQIKDVQAILGALEDAGCRQILEATTDDPLTASELADRCRLPLSTCYRKVHALTEAGLLRERTRSPRSGKKTKEYSHSIHSVTIPVGDPSLDQEGIVIRTAEAASATE
jgi:predicted transcriptional regulator